MSSLKVFPPCSRDSEALSFSSLTGYTISVSPATANSQLRLITRICRQGASWQTIRRSQPQPFPASACRLFPKRIFSTLASECKCGSQISFQKAFVKLLVTLLNERKHTHRVWQRRRRRQVGGHRPAHAECNPKIVPSNLARRVMKTATDWRVVTCHQALHESPNLRCPAGLDEGKRGMCQALLWTQTHSVDLMMPSVSERALAMSRRMCKARSACTGMYIEFPSHQAYFDSRSSSGCRQIFPRPTGEICCVPVRLI